MLVTPLRTLAWLSDWFDRHDHRSDWWTSSASIPRLLSSVPRLLHNGLVPSYALMMWTGVVLCMLFALRMCCRE